MIEDAAKRREIIARQIRQAMEAAGMNKVQLAEKMGKTPPYVTKWLSGKHNFTSDTLAELSQVLGVNITGVENDYQIRDCGSFSVNDTQYSIVLSPELGAATMRRAYCVGKDINEYVSDLISNDIERNTELPKVVLPDGMSRKVRKYAGILKGSPVQGDDRFDRIWNR